jgi:hypothetical protein
LTPPEDFTLDANFFTSALVIDGIEKPGGLSGAWRKHCIDDGTEALLAVWAQPYEEIAMALIPTQVTFRGLSHPDALEADIRQRVGWLEQFYGGIVRCRVLVEVPHRHRHRGRHFHVRIELTIPGRDPIVVSHEPSLHAGLKDVEDAAAHKEAEIDSVHRHGLVAIRETFDIARRLLEDAARIERNAVKTHEVSAQAPEAEI